MTLDSTRAAGEPDPHDRQELPESIGGYRILGKLGEGGMGVVYEAEQPSPRRKVALKVVRGGTFVDENRVRMFQREAETLARLKHPNIGTIHESGRTDDGQHYFVMELVRGDTLSEWLRKRPECIARDEIEHRLRLFRKIVDAVHYAHQRGVIHRDLKPSNIVVGEAVTGGDATASDMRVPEVKILDFGLARITDVDVATATMATEVGAIKGTLAYMSPEQARGNPAEIDLRCDVYALGVILYEMISGRRPYDLTNKSLVEAVRVICEQPLDSLSQAVGAAGSLDPDVETIAGKALEKEADRRYASAAALAEDVTRYLSSQAILARPPSAAYQLRKFARRNRSLVGGVVATFVVLLAGAVTATVFGLREAAQRREAVAAKDDLEAVVQFQAGMIEEIDVERTGRLLVEDLRERVVAARRERGDSDAEIASAGASFDALMSSVNPTDAALRVVDEDILERAGDTIENRFGDKPLIDARLREEIGGTYLELGLFERSEPHLLKAVEIRQRELGAGHEATLLAKLDLARLYVSQGRFDEAETVFDETLAGLGETLGELHPHTLRCAAALGSLYWKVGRYEAAEALLSETLAAQRRTLGDEHADTLITMNSLAVFLEKQERVDEAEPLYLECLDHRRRTLGEDHTATLETKTSLANLYASGTRIDEAEPLYLEVIESLRRMLGDEHPATLTTINDLGTTYAGHGRFDEALPLLIDSLEVHGRVYGEEHPETLRMQANLIAAYQYAGRPGDAEPYILRGLETRRRIYPADHWDRLRFTAGVIDLYYATGRQAEAAPMVAELLSFNRRAAEDPEATAEVKHEYARTLLRYRREDASSRKTALRYALEAAEMSGRRNLDHLDTLTIAYQVSGRLDEALENQKRVVAMMDRNTPPILREIVERRLKEIEAELAAE